MVFSSPTFLFLFLPLVLGLYLVLGRRARNPVLVVASLVFYAWGERFLVAIMLVSIAANYVFGRWVERGRQAGGGRGALTAAIVFNLGLLVAFKYANWLWDQLSDALQGLGLAADGLPREWEVRLPIGISFFTFQALSYVIDVYRGHARVQRNPVHFATYIALFPQLVAGPIVRYREIALAAGVSGPTWS